MPASTFCDELGLLGFVEGQNLKVDGGYGLRDEQLPEIAAAPSWSAACRDSCSRK
jgi:hypothetical protein